MSSWSAKLERVRFPALVGPPAPHDHISFSKLDETPLPADPRHRLDALRDRIAAILAKEPSGRTVAAPIVRASPSFDPSQGDLPFVRVDTRTGPLYLRSKHLSAAHRVGRARVRVGGEVSAGMLALLALDPALASVDPSRALYLDTETTGLSGGTGTVPFLIGLAWFEPPSGSLVVEQLLLRELGEEAPMLERLAERVARCSMLVTYNGKSFDMPLLASRLVLARLQTLPLVPHLDLVHVARRVHRHRLAQMTLRHVESEVLGFERTADIFGGEVCSRYTHFLRTGDELALTAVIDHNEWDIVAMAALVGLYGEPLAGLGPVDWVGVARTVRRAGSLDLAGEIAERAVESGVGSAAVRVRGEIAKAKGDKARALADFESLVETVDDPSLRLELAKLYEHHAKAPLAALALVARGTGETPEALSKRQRRLEKKGHRAKQRGNANR